MIQENISLKPYNTFGVEAKAAYFAEADSVEALIQTLKDFEAKSDKQNLLLLGGGSNILFTKDFDGLVLKINLKGITQEHTGENEVLVTAKASENWHEFVMYCLEQNYGGLENLSLIPGNVGTSPMQNIGAYGVEIKDVFHSCRALNMETLEIEVFDLKKCRFGYRDSFFKQEGKGRYIILDVTFRLTTKDHKIHTEYGAIKSELEHLGNEDPTIHDISDAVIRIRKSKLPDPEMWGNAGSFFKNPVVSLEIYEPLKKQHPEIPGYSDGKNVKIPAGWLIEHAGWKGKEIGNVATHDKQALVILNKTGAASGREILDFSEQIIASVKELFGVELEREVNII